MRIEVIVGQDDPKIYRLNKPKMILGTSESSDIVLYSDGVSRKHLQIILEDGLCFVVDQGSTNGTFMNDSRLVPGRRVQFTSFFPVRLGSAVLLTLLSDEDGIDSEPSLPSVSSNFRSPEATKVISLKELQARGRTEELIKKRQENMNRRKQAVKKEVAPKKSSAPGMWKGILASLAIMGVAGYYNLFVLQTQDSPDLSTKAPLPAPSKARPKAAVQVAKSGPIPQDKLMSLAELQSLLGEIKCTNDVEKYLCQLIPEASNPPWGVTQVMKRLVIFIEGSKFLTEAASFIDPPSPSTEGGLLTVEQTQKYKNDQDTLGVAYYMVKYFPRTLDFERLSNFDIYVVLFKDDGFNKKLTAGMAFGAGELKNFFLRLPEESVAQIQSYGMNSLENSSQSFRILLPPN